MKLKSFFVSEVTEAELNRERGKARELRKTQWWKNKRGRGVCYFCGEKVPPRELTMEHVVPLVRGGKSVKSNLVPACKSCNNNKKYLLPIEWDEYLASIRKTES